MQWNDGTNVISGISSKTLHKRARIRVSSCARDESGRRMASFIVKRNNMEITSLN